MVLSYQRAREGKHATAALPAIAQITIAMWSAGISARTGDTALSSALWVGISDFN
jgi:hypothetical protein